ncbi:MAG: GNAT family N-acetyltransferase [Microscillaceae bacterium]|nr:GNAT family N-acetyltransferase [Microscillaceae bacterium]
MNLSLSPWLPRDLSLKGQQVSLLPLERNLLAPLWEAAKDARIWTNNVLKLGQEESFGRRMQEAFITQSIGMEVPLVILHAPSQQVAGSTRFMNLDRDNNKLEIGWTWLHPDFWGTNLNTECKLLMLEYAFEIQQVARITLRCNRENLRSIATIKKLGATYEGTLRSEVLGEKQVRHDIEYYSILPPGMAGHKKTLQEQLSRGGAAASPAL